MSILSVATLCYARGRVATDRKAQEGGRGYLGGQAFCLAFFFALAVASLHWQGHIPRVLLMDEPFAQV